MCSIDAVSTSNEDETGQHTEILQVLTDAHHPAWNSRHNHPEIFREHCMEHACRRFSSQRNFPVRIRSLPPDLAQFLSRKCATKISYSRSCPITPSSTNGLKLLMAPYHVPHFSDRFRGNESPDHTGPCRTISTSLPDTKKIPGSGPGITPTCINLYSTDQFIIMLRRRESFQRINTSFAAAGGAVPAHRIRN